VDDPTNVTEEETTLILDAKAYDEPSVFEPEALLHEARRQKGLPEQPVPDVCVLDPDGDIVDHLIETGHTERFEPWPGYHTELYVFEHAGREYGIVGRAVGAPFAVLVAEQLFASGCELLVSVTSAGRIAERDNPPYFVLVESALRDEGTSLHYASPSHYAEADARLIRSVEKACRDALPTVYTGATWTTDAPFRETETAIERAHAEGILAVEMEASALYSFASVRGEDVICFAHVTNEMGRADEDFEKGEELGTVAALDVITAAVEGWSDKEPDG
jgi:uridine phosphorylase